MIFSMGLRSPVGVAMTKETVLGLVHAFAAGVILIVTFSGDVSIIGKLQSMEHLAVYGLCMAVVTVLVALTSGGEVVLRTVQVLVRKDRQQPPDKT